MKAGRIAWSIVGSLSLSTATRALDPIAILSPSDVPAGWDNGFGMSIAISGDWLVVGAPLDPWYNGDATGAVYVFRRVGARWVEHQKLVGFGGFQYGFGAPVAIDGDWMVSGEPNLINSTDCCHTGRVLVLRRDDAGTPGDLTDDIWKPVATLNPDFQIYPYFGGSVDIDDGVIVVGAPGGNTTPGGPTSSSGTVSTGLDRKQSARRTQKRAINSGVRSESVMALQQLRLIATRIRVPHSYNAKGRPMFSDATRMRGPRKGS